MPDGRSAEYAIYKACERFGVKPPGIKDKWVECDMEAKSMLLAYSQIREDEDAKAESVRLSAAIGQRTLPA